MSLNVCITTYYESEGRAFESLRDHHSKPLKPQSFGGFEFLGISSAGTPAYSRKCWKYRLYAPLLDTDLTPETPPTSPLGGGTLRGES
jgi:hypothetical protein